MIATFDVPGFGPMTPAQVVDAINDGRLVNAGLVSPGFVATLRTDGKIQLTPVGIRVEFVLEVGKPSPLRPRDVAMLSQAELLERQGFPATPPPAALTPTQRRRMFRVVETTPEPAPFTYVYGRHAITVGPRLLVKCPELGLVLIGKWTGQCQCGGELGDLRTS